MRKYYGCNINSVSHVYVFLSYQKKMSDETLMSDEFKFIDNGKQSGNKWPVWPEIHFETTEHSICAQSCFRTKTLKGEWIFVRFTQDTGVKGEADKKAYLKDRMSDLHRAMQENKSMQEHRIPFYTDRLIWPHSGEPVYVLDENQND